METLFTLDFKLLPRMIKRNMAAIKVCLIEANTYQLSLWLLNAIVLPIEIESRTLQTHQSFKTDFALHNI